VKHTSKHKHFDLTAFLDNLKTGIYRCSAGSQAKFFYVNSSLADILGYPCDKILRMRVSEIFEDSGYFRSLNNKIAERGLVKNEEVRLKRKDGHFVWCSMTAFAVKGGQGKIQWIDGVIEDISFRKRVEKELLESREIFRVVFDNSALAITVTNKDEKIIAWNPFTETMLGMEKKDLFNKAVKDLYPPAEWRRLRSLRIRRKGLLSGIETKIIDKNGNIVEVNLSVSILKDYAGNITGAIGIMRDITQQKIAERKLKESENKTRIILDHSAAAITLTDQEERIISWNKFTEQLLGMKRKDLYMKPVSSLYPKEEWQKIRRENIRKSGARYQLETKVIRKDGKIIDVGLSVNILKDTNGDILGSVGMFQDITEFKRIQQTLLQAKMAAEEASIAKSMFLANMSHEVRTPMNAIIGMIDMTLDTDLNDEQADNLKTAKDAADNLLSLLNDILDLSRVEAGKINLESIEFNLHNVLLSVQKGLAVLARKKNLDLRLVIDDNVPDALQGDPIRLRQIIINLINNAIKFTSKGFVELKASLVNRKEDEGEFMFSVTDTGIGIPREKQDMIFEPFTQADDSTTRKYGGTGLGLAISKRLVEMMNGHIGVESEVGQGSRFYFTVKLKIRKKAQLKPLTIELTEEKEETLSKSPVESLAKPTVPQPQTSPIKILIAEDNLINLKIAVKMLEKQGWPVTAVENGQQVLDILQKQEFDVILMDVQMPVLDGWKATQQIRENEKTSGRHIPIIAMTAHAMEGDEQKCLSAGMDGYVSKPIDRMKLFGLIEKFYFKKGAP